ncbi:hypothetical protein D9M72_189650 [compost metagenome]
MRSCQSSRNRASGWGMTLLEERNRSRAALAASNMEMFRLMQSTATGAPRASRSTVLMERIFCPSQLSFS